MVNVLSDSIIRSLVPQRITHVFAAEERLAILVLHGSHTTELKTVEFHYVVPVSCCILGSSTILGSGTLGTTTYITRNFHKLKVFY